MSFVAVVALLEDTGLVHEGLQAGLSGGLFLAVIGDTQGGHAMQISLNFLHQRTDNSRRHTSKGHDVDYAIGAGMSKLDSFADTQDSLALETVVYIRSGGPEGLSYILLSQLAKPAYKGLSVIMLDTVLNVVFETVGKEAGQIPFAQ